MNAKRMLTRGGNEEGGQKLFLELEMSFRIADKQWRNRMVSNHLTLCCFVVLLRSVLLLIQDSLSAVRPL